jgi:proline dehydrogenase
VALKLTHLGLDVSEALAQENLRRVVERAAELGNFVRIDMESSAAVDPTLRIYRALREAGLDNVGTVLQSYLYRTPDDLEALLPLRPNLRLVKGAYLEPPEVAYPRKDDVDAAYVRLVERSLSGGGYTAIATHDERMIEHAIAFAEREGIGRDRFELQMLYGVRPQLQADLVARGFKVLVATPFGPEWFPFFTRRLAERPANLGFVLRNLVRR